MIRFYSHSHAQSTRWPTAVAFLFLFIIIVGLLAVGYAIFLVLKFVFAESLLLGLLFIFFGLPLLVRFLFSLYFTVIGSLVSSVFLKNTSQTHGKEAPGGVIDVSYKIEK